MFNFFPLRSHFCTMRILCCNDALLGQQFYREVEAPRQDSDMSGRDMARDTKATVQAIQR